METIKFISLEMRKEKDLPFVSERKSIDDMVKILRDTYGNPDREILGFAGLDNRNNVTVLSTIGIGTVNATIIHPREVFKAAIVANCSKIVLFHNHPGGLVYTSKEDVKQTKRLALVGDIMDIEVIDHIVYTNDSYMSMAEEGQMREVDNYVLSAQAQLKKL